MAYIVTEATLTLIVAAVKIMIIENVHEQDAKIINML